MGGGPIRAAAKVAGTTVANGVLRNITSEHFSAARVAGSSRTPAAMAAEDVKVVASKSQISETEDWVFAGAEEESIKSDSVTIPRVIFGGAPTLQEAKDATSELTVALEKVYLSSPGSKVEVDHSGLQCTEKSEIAPAPTAPANAIKAFSFLNESSVAQNVVASIACDPNVWNAMLHNEELQEFLQSQRASLSSSSVEQSSAENDKVASDYVESQPDNGFMEIVVKVKINVVDMVSSLSDYFKDFFGPQGRAYRVFATGDISVSADTAMEASFMGLAVMAVMVILLKRV